MKKFINYEERDSILKIVAIAVCVLELFITLLTLAYQQDVVKRSETPITNEMARDYMDHPDKLRSNERVSYNAYGSVANQRTYLLVKEFDEVVPFPWKAWILISVGAPIGIAFLILLLTKAYFQTVDPEENQPVENTGKFISALNRLSQINIIWFMLISIIVLFLFWYIPEIIKYTGGVAMHWLTQYWWIPVTVLAIGVSLIIWWVYLQYKLRVKAMNMEMELAKFKYLQLEGNGRPLIGGTDDSNAPLLEEKPVEDCPTESSKMINSPSVKPND